MRLVEAEAALARLVASAPEHPERYFQAGELRKRRGDYAGAAAIFAEEVAARPLDVNARCRLTDTLSALGRHEAALAAVEAGLACIPGNPWLLSMRARMLAVLRRFEEAEAVLAALAHHHPAHPALPELRGRLAEQRGDLAAAAAAFEADLAWRPHDIWPRLRLVGCLAAQGRLDAALALLSEGLAAAPGNAWLLGERINLRLRAGQPAEAEADVEELARAAPEDCRIGDFRTRIREAAGDLAGAAEWVARDLAARPENPGLRQRLIGLLRQIGDTERALAVARAPARPGHADCLAQAYCLAELGRLDAVEDLLAHWPAGEEPGLVAQRQAATRLARARFDHARAIALANSVLAARPGDAQAEEALCEALTLSFQPAAARQAAGHGIRRPDGRRGPTRLGSLLGQILNELELRPEQTADLAAAALLPGRAQAVHAAGQILQDGEAIGPAIALLTGFARAGLLRRFAPAPDAPPVPRLLHQFWDSPEPPPDVAAMMARSAAANPGLGHRRWDEAGAEAWLAASGHKALLRAFRLAQPAAAKADLFRLALLYREGGFWLDPDDWCGAPLLNLLPEGARLVLYQEHYGSIGNNFIAAAPGHEWLGEAVEEAVRAVLDGDCETVWLTTGPGLLTRIVASAIARRHPLDLPQGFALLPTGAFWAAVRPYRAMAYKSGHRHWSNQLASETDAPQALPAR